MVRCHTTRNERANQAWWSKYRIFLWCHTHTILSRTPVSISIWTAFSCIFSPLPTLKHMLSTSNWNGWDTEAIVHQGVQQYYTNRYQLRDYSDNQCLPVCEHFCLCSIIKDEIWISARQLKDHSLLTKKFYQTMVKNMYRKPMFQSPPLIFVRLRTLVQLLVTLAAVVFSTFTNTSLRVSSQI